MTILFLRITPDGSATARASSALGYLLETLQVHAPSLLQACETSVSSGIGLLDPSLPDVGPVVWRWRLRENGRVSSDGMAS